MTRNPYLHRLNVIKNNKNIFGLNQKKEGNFIAYQAKTSDFPLG